MNKYVKLYALVITCFMIISCEWSKERFQKDVNSKFQDVVAIEFDFEAPYGNKIITTDTEEIGKLKIWLLNAKPMKAIASYPDTLIPVKIKDSKGHYFEFKVSPKLEGIDYTVINWSGNHLIGGNIPLEIEALSNTTLKK